MLKKQKQSEKEMTTTELAALMLDIKNSLAEQIMNIEKELSDKIDTAVDTLAQATAKGFEKVEERFGEMDKQFDEMREGFVAVRRDILNQNDKFPSQYSFDQLSTRVVLLEKQAKKKK